MFDDTKIRIWDGGPAELENGLDERRREIEDLEMRIAGAESRGERARLQTRLAEVRAEYAPSGEARRRSFF